jgi:thiamine-phosphate diphosphorylase
MPLSRQRGLICLVTDRRQLSPDDDATAIDRLIELVGAAGSAGVDLIHVRERDLEARNLTMVVRRCIDAVAGTGAKVVVNDRADVALAARAHGVHLRSDSVEAQSIRSLLLPDAIVGRSVHSAEEATTVSRAGGLDYLIFGTLFPTPSKSATSALAAATELSKACAETRIPILAIGGITSARADQIARSGAAGVAGIGLFLPPPDVRAEEHLHVIVNHLRRVFDTCGAVT